MILFKYPKGLVTPVFYLLKIFYTSHLVFKVINWVLYNLDNVILFSVREDSLLTSIIFKDFIYIYIE